MLVIFSCNVYPNTTYFGEVAHTLLKMMGHSGNMPGAILADDVPTYLARLQCAIDKLKADTNLKNTDSDPEQEDWKEKPVTLALRALPLIELLTASAKAHCDVMWDRS